MANIKKKWYPGLIIFVLIVFTQACYALPQVFSTPWYQIELEKPIEQLKTQEVKMKDTSSFSYAYGGLFKESEVEANLTIQVVRLSRDEMRNFSEAAQLQFIFSMANQIQRKQGTHVTDPIKVSQLTKTVLLGGREFKKYSYPYQGSSIKGQIEILTTVKAGNLYGFILSCYGRKIASVNQVSQLILNQIAKIKIQ